MIFQNDQQRAIAYAAQKQLEKLLKADEEEGFDIPAGFTADLSGRVITLQFAPGTTVERDVGIKGDGIVLKKATQNLYGYPLWAFMIERLRKFNQWNAIKVAIVEAIKEVMKRQPNEKSMKKELQKKDPEFDEIIENLKKEFPIPDRKEDTPRLCKAELPPTITIK